MRAVCLDKPEILREQESVLPIRRFNPGSLVTHSGQSVIAQLRKVCGAIVVEDLDLDPKSLRRHMEQFCLTHSAVVQFIHDGFSTEVYHYVITGPELAACVKGERIW